MKKVLTSFLLSILLIGGCARAQESVNSWNFDLMIVETIETGKEELHGKYRVTHQEKDSVFLFYVDNQFYDFVPYDSIMENRSSIQYLLMNNQSHPVHLLWVNKGSEPQIKILRKSEVITYRNNNNLALW